MIINWLAEKAQHLLSIQDAGLDELSVHFDFALSAEIMGLLSAQNDECVEALAEADAVSEESAITPFALDEYELALA